MYLVGEHAYSSHYRLHCQHYHRRHHIIVFIVIIVVVITIVIIITTTIVIITITIVVVFTIISTAAAAATTIIIITTVTIITVCCFRLLRSHDPRVGLEGAHPETVPGPGLRRFDPTGGALPAQPGRHRGLRGVRLELHRLPLLHETRESGFTQGVPGTCRHLLTGRSRLANQHVQARHTTFSTAVSIRQAQNDFLFGEISLWLTEGAI